MIQPGMFTHMECHVFKALCELIQDWQRSEVTASNPTIREFLSDLTMFQEGAPCPFCRRKELEALFDAFCANPTIPSTVRTAVLRPGGTITLSEIVRPRRVVDESIGPVEVVTVGPQLVDHVGPQQGEPVVSDLVCPEGLIQVGLSFAIRNRPIYEDDDVRAVLWPKVIKPLTRTVISHPVTERRRFWEPIVTSIPTWNSPYSDAVLP